MKDQIKGAAEELKGKVTGDKTDEAKGKARRTMGDLKSKARDVHADVKEEIERAKQHRHDAPPPPASSPGR
ncbi:MAG: CsbD family protein [Acidobacteria bacterium]|nr:CsbD family protein [Acidobacteriota bacterium]